MKHFLVGWLIIGSSLCLFAQETKTDSTQQAKPDSLITKSNKRVINIETYSKRFNPRKAMLYSAVFPGMGQIYNKKYWKVPIVYGGFYLLISVVSFYNQSGNLYRNDLFDLLDGKIDPISKKSLAYGLDEAQLRNIINQAQRQRDYFLIFTGFLYLLQMVDAHVDAHLKEFDLNPKLKVRVDPMMETNYYTGTSTGLSIKLRF